MICSKCGQLLLEGSDKCWDCGTIFKVSSQKKIHSDNNDIEKLDIIRRIDEAMPFYNGVQKILNKINRLTILKTFIISGRVSLFNIVIRFAITGFILTLLLFVLFGRIYEECLTIALVYGIFGRFIDTLLINLRIKILNTKMIKYVEENSSFESTVLAPMYRYTDAAIYIKQCIINDKADTLREAYKLYDKYAHQQRVDAQLSLMSQLMINSY